MKSRVLVAAVAAALTLVLANAAWARNPHCAGGIQYLTLALADKQKGSTEDYQREIQKAVQQLEACASEDPSDFEGSGYLGWAYAEVDSMGPAGKAFQVAIDGLKSKGDKKKVDMFQTNLESYWRTTFNKGIKSIGDAQALWNPYVNAPSNDEEKKLKADAKLKYEQALAGLNQAASLKPADPTTLRDLGVVHAFMGDYTQAESYFKRGLDVAPGDSLTLVSLKQSRIGHAAQLVREQKFAEAVAYYQDLLKTDPKNGDLWSGLGDAALEQAKTVEGDAKKPIFIVAGEAYGQAARLGGGSFELSYNAAICYQNAGNLAAAEEQWRAALQKRPADRDVLMNLSSVLVDEKKFPDAITAAMTAVSLDPKDKLGFRRLSGVYSKSNDNLRSKQFALAFLALDKGTASDAPTAASGADGAKLVTKMGKPESIVLWEAEGQKYETWFYASKGLAFHFGGGTQQEKTDWSAALAAK